MNIVVLAFTGGRSCNGAMQKYNFSASFLTIRIKTPFLNSFYILFLIAYKKIQINCIMRTFISFFFLYFILFYLYTIWVSNWFNKWLFGWTVCLTEKWLLACNTVPSVIRHEYEKNNIQYRFDEKYLFSS